MADVHEGLWGHGAAQASYVSAGQSQFQCLLAADRPTMCYNLDLVTWP